MTPDSGFSRLESPAELARFQGWSQAVYEDLMAVESGRMSEREFDRKYLVTRAILVLDVTGFTLTAIHGGAIRSFLRILAVQRISLPTLLEHGPRFIRAFADDIVALFDDCDAALRAALEIQRRLAPHEPGSPQESAPECCIGIGYGEVYEIGPNHAMGDEMNRASVLGEDLARGGEILITENAYRALAKNPSLAFEPQRSDDLLFPYYRVTPTGKAGRLG